MLGVTLPDPELKWNEELGHYEFGPIDWSEFWNVVNGNGQCNRERLGARVKAWQDGAWVRKGALAYAAKAPENATANAAEDLVGEQPPGSTQPAAGSAS